MSVPKLCPAAGPLTARRVRNETIERAPSASYRCLSGGVRDALISPRELFVFDRPPHAARSLHDPIARMGHGPPFHRSQHHAVADLPRANGADAAPANGIQPLVRLPEFQIADRTHIAGLIGNAPVAVGAGQLVAGSVAPGVPGGKPLGADLADAQGV